MAEDSDQASKTEEATPRKLEEARRRGEVAKSTDLSSWATLAGTAGALAILGGWITQDLAHRLLPFIANPDAIDLHGTGAVEVLRVAGMAALPALAVVLGAGAVSGLFGNLIQHGFMWSPDRMKPDLSKVSPMSGFKRLFGLDGFIQFLKSLLKVALVSGVAWWAIKPHTEEVQRLAAMQAGDILPYSAGVVRSLTFAVVAVLGVGALLDWLWQRQRFMQKMRMSREEMKEDVRQSEGDPHVKAKQRQLRLERARRRMIQNVPKATVVVMNPTHYAVALRYEAGVTLAPVCVAKGTDRVALRIREVAEKANVAVIEDPPLARALYAAVEIDEAIPLDHYQAVAKVIGFVMDAARKRSVWGG